MNKIEEGRRKGIVLIYLINERDKYHTKQESYEFEVLDRAIELLQRRDK